MPRAKSTNPPFHSRPSRSANLTQGATKQSSPLQRAKSGSGGLNITRPKRRAIRMTRHQK